MATSLFRPLTAEQLLDRALGAHRKPSWSLMGVEPLRAAIEFASLQLMHTDDLPRGDGHRVIIFPGLAADQSCLRPLTQLCRSLGYDARDWGRGINTGPTGRFDDWLEGLADEVRADAVTGTGRDAKLSLVGWSLGGIYAREVARLLPRHVRQVITIGTPFAAGGDSTNAAWLYRLLNGQVPLIDAATERRLRETPPVPTTSIYSRTDGVVAWPACREDERQPQAENVELDGSHLGLVWNPAVLKVVADRLAQPAGAWRRYGAAQEGAANGAANGAASGAVTLCEA